MALEPRSGTERNSVLGKVFAILDVFGPEDTALPLAEICRRAGVAKPTAHRLLAELLTARLVERTDDGYRLGRRLFTLGTAVSSVRALRLAALPAMQDLARRSGSSVELGVMEHDAVLCVDAVDRDGRSVPARAGIHLPLHTTALGKALLAFCDPDSREAALGGAPGTTQAGTTQAGTGRYPVNLRRELDTIAIEGVAHDVQESALGLATTAAPIRDEHGVVVAALSLATQVGRFRSATATGMVAAAEAISAALAATGRSTRPGRPTSPARPRALRRLTVAAMPYIDVAPLWVAAQEGIFARNGIQITLTPVTGPGVTPSLLAGMDADLGVTTAPDLLNAVEHGLALRAVAGLSVNTINNPRLFLVAGGGSGITHPTQLVGRRVGVSTRRGYLQVGSEALLRRLGADPNRVEWVPLHPSRMRRALREGVVDAVAAPLPLPTLLERDGGSVVLNLAELGPSTLDVFVAARADWIAGNHEATDRFALAIHEATDLLRKEPMRALRVRERFARLAPEVSAEINVGTYIDVPRPEQLDFWIDLMGANHLITQPIRAENLLAV
ncbi:IclR family transcriptional regulator C-terminal domain-containing protein [Sphaerisporangium sp. NPDC088356]|uniref:IclR family transcriptional regulator domain-containing protein n=1 Tax=Sphaerisporangium sp. NPDC088356 TaxID=3154871 RepID=UPI00343CC7CB